jgi:hypothetical protein
MTKQTASNVASYKDPSAAMDAAVTQYATGERSRPVVASDGQKFYVCSKATAKSKGWTIEAKLFQRTRTAGAEGVQAARKDAAERKPRKDAVLPQGADFFANLDAKEAARKAGKHAAKRTERAAKLAEVKAA